MVIFVEELRVDTGSFQLKSYVLVRKEKNSKKALQIERLARNECPPLRKIKDFRIRLRTDLLYFCLVRRSVFQNTTSEFAMPLCRPQDWEKYEVGQKVWPSDFLEEGDTVDVHGRSELTCRSVSFLLNAS